MMSAVLIVLALFLVSFGADILVKHASFLAVRAGISPLIVGLTIVGFGTSSPELGASLTATLAGFDDISVGNVIGSNIFNIAFILAVTAIISPVVVELSAIRTDIYFAIGAALVPFASLLSGGMISWPTGVLLLLILAAYLWIAFRRSKHVPQSEEEKIAVELAGTFELPAQNSAQQHSLLPHIGWIVLSLGLLIYGSKLFVDNAVSLARMLGVSELVIGLTIVSVGTSLPELITSVVAALRRNTDIAVGNLLGSNIFNSFCILGACAVTRPQRVTPQSIWVDAPVMLLVTLALLPMVKTGGIISRSEGIVLLLVYLGYLGYLLI